MADADSLVLFLDSTAPLHQQMRTIERSLIDKIVAGRYDASKAKKAFSYVTEEAAKRYVHELGRAEDLPGSWHLAFPKKVRDEADAYLAERFWSRVQLDPQYVAEVVHAKDVRKHHRGPVGRSQTDLVKGFAKHLGKR